MAELRGLVPYAHVADVSRSVEFYEQLGFQVDNTFEHEGLLNWAYLSRNGAQLMVARATEPVDPAQQAVLFYLYADDVEAYHRELAEKGLEVGELEPRFYMESGEFEVRDPDGYCLLVGHV